MSDVQSICEAIRKRALLDVSLSRVGGGWLRPTVVASPGRGAEVLRAVQVRGESASGGLGFGKLWTVDEIRELRILDESFVPDDPNYNPRDRAMTRIYCAMQL